VAERKSATNIDRYIDPDRMFASTASAIIMVTNIVSGCYIRKKLQSLQFVAFITDS